MAAAPVRYCLGIDFDNTLVSYDALLYREARQRRLIGPEVQKHKRQIRDRIRQRPGGELEWQRLQALVYGQGMGRATLQPGAWAFLETCHHDKIPVYIISHKTQFAALDETKTDLQQAALRWIEQQRFFEPDGLGLSRGRVYFEPTRAQKIHRIQALACTHFIDDLEETFLEPSFPSNVTRILYAASSSQRGMLVMRSWDQITDYFFHGRDSH